MSLADPGLALVLDPERLSSVVGREVSATHLRPKPGVSTVASLLDAEGMPWGWVRTLTGGAVAKAGKARHRAEEVGLAGELGEAELGGRDTLVQWGPLATDPRPTRMPRSTRSRRRNWRNGTATTRCARSHAGMAGRGAAPPRGSARHTCFSRW